MTASGKQYAVGVRQGRFYSLSPTTGLPNGASAGVTAYAGLEVEAITTFDVTDPDFRDINFPGNDTAAARDALPAETGMGAKVMSSQLSYAVRQLLSGVLQVTLGEAVGMRYGTDVEAYGPLVGFMAFAQSVPSSVGGRHYHVEFVPRARVQAKAVGMQAQPVQTEYNLYSIPVTQELWGLPLVQSTAGATSLQFSSYMFPYRPIVLQWLQSSGTPAKLLIPLAFQPPTTTQIYAFTRNGADVLAAATKAVDGITPAAAADLDVFVAVIGY